MNLVRTNNWLPSVFEDMFNRDWLKSNDDFYRVGASVPAANVKETNDSFVVEIAAPGMKKEDFKVELDQQVLTISSEIKEEHESENKEEKFTRKEFSYQAFQRSFNLPDSIDSQKIKAGYENGVLKVELPKKEEAKEQPKRFIEIA